MSAALLPQPVNPLLPGLGRAALACQPRSPLELTAGSGAPASSVPNASGSCQAEGREPET